MASILRLGEVGGDKTITHTTIQMVIVVNLNPELKTSLRGGHTFSAMPARPIINRASITHNIDHDLIKCALLIFFGLLLFLEEVLRAES